MMKFVIIQCVKAYHHELEQIFKSIKINTYSEMDVEGFMKNVDGDSDFSNWFGSRKNPYNYMVSFTFLAEDKANELLQRIDEFNHGVEAISPMNAYIVGVEKYV
ncbi:hypothetical protein [Gaoshiqia sediminis]|uniref:Uncharacterized protein n=1 Tax=Gaoshiqia sediminis TaxID=2986998 RepID=A0AA41Y9K0_9BACT|nr:hypothetical protein [Gaoshiqia sediminis]MCW0483463.1 hypothetical protein [Gaoshiqia sediminis]